ncbi:MAG TPA: carboxypeptidase regulatory-like domain-containing protein [Blastocatellia bacterium]|nr:carboxypeptidase regulatory-like domain-containing protein [Blastocatellia bacterium]
MLSRRVIAAFLLILAFALGAACGKGETAAPAGPLWKPSGNEGNITGVINFTGAVPAPSKLDMSSDSKCEGENFLDDVVAKDGKLQNVFVFVKSGLPQASFETPTDAVTLDQRGCKYVPRVLGIQAGQPFKVVNSDSTNHNIHTLPRVNREFDSSQLAGQGPITRKFAKPEAIFPVKCNQHSWMRAHIAVLAHPFFAVSDSKGAFTIKGLPPGEYEIEAWHERYGAKTAKIKVAEKADAKAEFTFGSSVAYQPGSLKIQPAMMTP